MKTTRNPKRGKKSTMNVHKNALNLDEKSSDNKGFSVPKKTENSMSNSSDEMEKLELPNAIFEDKKDKDGIHLF
jgi:hypothetical protein